MERIFRKDWKKIRQRVTVEDMILDEVIIHIKAGDGGKGAVAFNKNLMSLGPAGGSGGNGGDVYIEGSSDLTLLNQFRHKKKVQAENGKDGRSQFRDGNKGEDLVLKVPVGTVTHNIETGESVEVVHPHERKLIAQGGRGGRGNFLFRSSVNTSPKEFEEGKKGEEGTFKFELKFIADVGLIGLPNVGKSTLLNELTNANSKVANYKFTTLEPHLGVYYDLILADIPGLIEGASEGKGLGHKFLRHIERTSVLFHLVSAQSDDVAGDYKTIRSELKKFNAEIIAKEEYVFLSKSDEVEEKEVAKKIKALQKLNPNVKQLSIIDEKSMKEVKRVLEKIEQKKNSSA